jgi:hypothetical protein
MTARTGERCWLANLAWLCAFLDAQMAGRAGGCAHGRAVLVGQSGAAMRVSRSADGGLDWARCGSTGA